MSKIKTDHMFKVKDLMDFLKNENPETYIVMSSDSEGNSYSPLSNGMGAGYYIPDSTWSGEWIATEDKDEYKGQQLLPCIVFFPVN
jgi:hypothetical protein